MVAALVILALLVIVGMASALGRTADSRDPDYGVGPILRHAGGSPRR